MFVKQHLFQSTSTSTRKYAQSGEKAQHEFIPHTRCNLARTLVISIPKAFWKTHDFSLSTARESLVQEESYTAQYLLHDRHMPGTIWRRMILVQQPRPPSSCARDTKQHEILRRFRFSGRRSCTSVRSNRLSPKGGKKATKCLRACSHKMSQAQHSPEDELLFHIDNTMFEASIRILHMCLVVIARN